MRRALIAAACVASVACAACGAAGFSPPQTPASGVGAHVGAGFSPPEKPSPDGGLKAAAPSAAAPSVAADLDTIFADPVIARALLGVRVESLRDGRVIYQHNSEKLVVPASNMKLVTMAVAAARLGWDFTYETKLDAVGVIDGGVLHGDLVVSGSGDPTIGSHDANHAELFLEWADELRAQGITKVDGRVIGDDSAFDDAGLGAGWAWDYLADGYAAPSGALSYNENVSVVRVTPGASPGTPATMTLGPPGHRLAVTSEITTGEARTPTSINFSRLPGSAVLVARGSVPAGGAVAIRTVAVDNPTRYFVEAFTQALVSRGILVTQGAWDIDDVAATVTSPRRAVATHRSPPLSLIAGNFLKPSQNFYGEMLLKTMGRAADLGGTTEAGRQVVKDVMTSWGIPADSFVMYDGSGLSRYNYVTADTIVSILKHVWADDTLRGPFVAALPVGGRDGTLDTRMKNTVLDRNVRAKTGTISNMRALSGFVETASGETLVFSMIANHFTATSAQIDAVVERALVRLVGQ